MHQAGLATASPLCQTLGLFMALDNAIFGAIADLAQGAINLVAKKLGKTEVHVKQLESYLFWFVFLSFIAFICYITFKYS